MNTQQISDKILQNILLQDYLTAKEKNKEKLPEYITEDQKEEQEEEEEEKEEKGSRKKFKDNKRKKPKEEEKKENKVELKWSSASEEFEQEKRDCLTITGEYWPSVVVYATTTSANIPQYGPHIRSVRS